MTTFILIQRRDKFHLLVVLTEPVTIKLQCSYTAPLCML